jgi:S1-C subfamily serine protease
MKRLLLLVVLLMPTTVWADFSDGLAAYERGDYATAMREWRPLAEQGDTYAQLRLGLLYHLHRDDKTEAVRWYRKAAEQGHSRAQVFLASMYEAGLGVPQNDAEAVRWYRKAAEQGDDLGQESLGVKYHQGRGVPEDFVQAYAWYNLAAAQGRKMAAENKDNIRKHMTPTQIAEAQRLSRTLAQRIARGESVSTARVTAPPRRTGPPRAMVTAAQKLLGRLGYKPGAVDGLAGKRTRSAVRAFQTDLGMSPTGVVSQELVALLQVAVAAITTKQDQAESPPQRASGSAFFVRADGHLITNHHVVKGCDKVTVSIDGSDKPVVIVSVDEGNDLALLKASTGSQTTPAMFRQSRRANLGERVIVAGYPLGGLLSSELNVTTGTVSALAGLGDNPRVIQITAPVQAGNSGGPLLDKSGHVIGVVVSKLNAAKVYQVTGDFPQNINFAIKGSLVRGFLDIHGVDYRVGASDATVGNEAVAAMAQKFVVSVGCWK